MARRPRHFYHSHSVIGEPERDTRSSWSVVKVTDDIVFILDNDDGSLSVTNDAEAVVEVMVKRFGNKRIVYRDTMGRWDELGHDAGRFIGYAPYSGPTSESEQCG